MAVRRQCVSGYTLIRVGGTKNRHQGYAGGTKERISPQRAQRNRSPSGVKALA